MTDGAPTYEEPARSYASLWILVAVFALGIGVDAILGGAQAHLLGWAIAFVIVGGAHLLLLYAVRSSRSLRLDADELRVGEEAVPRADIVAVATEVDDVELPVLGWPGGRPRGVSQVIVRLVDGRDVLVPTRFPDRLATALGVRSVIGQRAGQDVRAAARSELPLLAEIDERAEAIFRSAGYQLPAIESGVAELSRAKAVFVAGRPPVGFVQIDEVDGLAHLSEIAVVPRWMRQGIGTRLLERACEWARAHDYPAITLTTYADVPWNGPYYAARGFVELGELTPGLAEVRAREAALGLDAVGRRIAMRREL